jgi:hypothetical protein
VLLAFKVEENIQKVRVVINCARGAWTRGAAAPLEQRGAEFRALRQAVLDAERALLFTLGFDVGVTHPFRAVADALTAWKEEGVFEPAGWPRAAKNSAAPQAVVKTFNLAHNLAFALLGTTAALRFAPAEIALAALALAADIAFAEEAHADAPGRSPVSVAAVRRAAGSARALADVALLRARVPELLAPLVAGDAAVCAARGARGPGVPPTAVVLREPDAGGAMPTTPTAAAGSGGGGWTSGGGAPGSAVGVAAAAAAAAPPPPDAAPAADEPQLD